MNILKNILVSVAFVLAIGAAFASTKAVTAQSRQTVTTCEGTVMGSCQVITISLSSCDTTFPRLCDIQSAGIWWRYFSDTNCQTPYKKP